MKTFKISFILAILLIISAITAVTAQVTIGADNAPQDFSILELISGGDKGLRLPQVETTGDRDAIEASFAGHETAAMGLQIFNKETQCVETWNGAVWIAACVTPPAPTASAQQLCTGSLISDLSVSGEAGAVFKWYAAASGDAALAASTALTAGTYWVSQTNSYGNESPRTSVAVTLTSGVACGALSSSAYKIFSPVSVMYTYQYQDLELYKGVTTGGDATRFQWYVKKKGVAGNGTEIPSATSAVYQVPSNYTTQNDTLVFTCEYSNPATSTSQTVSTEIEFIKLDESKFIDINGVKYYYVELDAPASYTGATTSSRKIKVLATNLGVESADAADLGDFYQWGRVADGHEKIGWGYTDGTSRTVSFDAASTSGAVAKTGAITYDANSPAGENGTPFLQVTDTYHKGKFVYAASPPFTWRPDNNTDQYIWATSAYGKTANDPCPAGWHVPTSFEWGALMSGTPATLYTVSGQSGIYNSSTSGSQTTVSTYNTWRYPAPGFGSSSHVGGIVITQGNNNPNGTTRLFVPASGCRYYHDGTLVVVGSSGYYWSSTYLNTSTSSVYSLHFLSGSVNAGNNVDVKANGFSVRCVCEE